MEGGLKISLLLLVCLIARSSFAQIAPGKLKVGGAGCFVVSAVDVYLCPPQFSGILLYGLPILKKGNVCLS